MKVITITDKKETGRVLDLLYHLQELSTFCAVGFMQGQLSFKLLGKQFEVLATSAYALLPDNIADEYGDLLVAKATNMCNLFEQD